MLATLPHLSFLSSLRLRLAFLPSLPPFLFPPSPCARSRQSNLQRPQMSTLRAHRSRIPHSCVPTCVHSIEGAFLVSITPSFRITSTILHLSNTSHELHTWLLIMQEGFSHAVLCCVVYCRGSSCAAVRYQEIRVRGGGSVRSISKSITGRMLVCQVG